MASHQLTKFGGHRDSESEDIAALFWHVISQDHVIKGQCEFCREKPIEVSYHNAKFGGHRHCVSGNIMILVCHVIFQDHVIKGSSW